MTRRITILLIAFNATIANAADINVGDKLYDFLPKPPPPCDKCAMTPLHVGLVMGPVRLIPKDLHVETPVFLPTPNAVIRRTYLSRNCSNSDQAVNTQLKLSYENSTTSVIGNTFSSKTGVTISIPAKFAKVDGSNEITFSASQTITTVEKKTEDETQNIDVKVPKHTARLFILEERIRTGYIKYNGTVIADADSHLEDSSGNTVSRHVPVSTFASEDKRTFNISGEIWNIKGENKTYTYLDKLLDPNDRTQCQDFDINTGEIIDSNLAENNSHPMIEDFSRAVKIKTADHAGTIDVRAKSHAAVFCEAIFSYADKIIKIAAPPGEWSQWFTVSTHSRAQSAQIVANPGCQTGADFQVRYDK